MKYEAQCVFDYKTNYELKHFEPIMLRPFFGKFMEK